VCRAEGRVVTEWRAQFEAFDCEDRHVSQSIVEAFLRETATPKILIGLLEALEQENVLIRYDAHRLEEQILRHVTKDGQWKQQRGRQPA
jgi:hypothetical protein